MGDADNVREVWLASRYILDPWSSNFLRKREREERVGNKGKKYCRQGGKGHNGYSFEISGDLIEVVDKGFLALLSTCYQVL